MKNRGHHQQNFLTPNVNRPSRNTQTKKLQGPYYFNVYSVWLRKWEHIMKNSTENGQFFVNFSLISKDKEGAAVESP
jgi:hypothetical protein